MLEYENNDESAVRDIPPYLMEAETPPDAPHYPPLNTQWDGDDDETI